MIRPPFYLQFRFQVTIPSLLLNANFQQVKQLFPAVKIKLFYISIRTFKAMAGRHTGLFEGMTAMKCPACRSEALFVQPKTFLLKDIGVMHAQCPRCGNNNRVEPGFYFGAAYVSYILMVGLLMFFVSIYYLIFGEIFDHFMRLMTGASLLALLSTPWIFRYSRVLFLYMFVRYRGKQY